MNHDIGLSGDAVTDAVDKFFETLMKHHPEIKSGDIDPWELEKFMKVAEAIAEHWIEVNHPRGQ